MNGNELPICPLCGTPITENDYTTECPDCHMVYHEECWEANDGCSTPQCSQNHSEDEEYRRQSLNWAMPAGAQASAPEPPDEFPPLDDAMYPVEESLGAAAEVNNPDVSFEEAPLAAEFTEMPLEETPAAAEENIYQENIYDENVNAEPVRVELDKDELNRQKQEQALEALEPFSDPQTDIAPPDTGLDLSLEAPQSRLRSLDLEQLNGSDLDLNNNAEETHFEINNIENNNTNNNIENNDAAPSDVKPLEYSSKPPQSGIGAFLKKSSRDDDAPLSILRYPARRSFGAPNRQPSVTRLKSSLSRDGADEKYVADVLDDIKDLNIPLHSSPAPVRPAPQRGQVRRPPQQGAPGQQQAQRKPPAQAAQRPEAKQDGVPKDENLNAAGRPMQIRGTPVPRTRRNPFMTAAAAAAVGVIGVVLIGMMIFSYVMPNPKNVAFRKDQCILAVSDSTPAEYVIDPPRAARRTKKWETSNEDVAVVSDDGMIRAVGEGKCDITLSVGNKTAVEHVSIIPQVEDILFRTEETELIVGNSMRVDFDVVPHAASEAPTEVTTSDPDIAEVDGMKVNALSPGDCIVTVTVGKKRANMIVHVVAAVTDFSVDTKNLTLTAGESVPISYSVSPPEAADRLPQFDTSNSDVAIVENGQIVAVGSGDCEITGRLDSFVQRISVTVRSSVTSLTLDKETINMYVGESAKVSAKTEPASDMTISWSSSNESVATVGDDGSIKAVGDGTARITARAGDLRKTVDVIVRSQKSKEASKKLAGTWTGRYAYDSSKGKVKALSGYESVLIAYANGDCSITISGSRLSGTWTYMEDNYYMFNIDGGATAMGQIQDVSDVKNGLIVVFDDIDGSKMEVSIVYQKTS